MSDTNRYFSRFHVLPESSQNSVTFRSVTSEPVIFDHKNVDKELARIFLFCLYRTYGHILHKYSHVAQYHMRLQATENTRVRQNLLLILMMYGPARQNGQK